LSDTLELLNSYDHYSVLKEFNGELDSALYYVNLSLAFKRLKHDTNGIPFSLNKIANLHLLKGHHAYGMNISLDNTMYLSLAGDFASSGYVATYTLSGSFKD
jgi:hypothetical protein